MAIQRTAVAAHTLTKGTSERIVKESSAKAAALAYGNAQEKLPNLVAKGTGSAAEKIIQRAKELEIPLFQNRELVDSLLQTPPEEEISPALYQATLQVFLWLCESEKKAQLSS